MIRLSAPMNSIPLADMGFVTNKTDFQRKKRGCFFALSFLTDNVENAQNQEAKFIYTERILRILFRKTASGTVFSLSQYLLYNDNI